MPPTPNRPSARRRALKLVLILLGLVALYALLVGVITPPILRAQAEKRLAALTGSDVRIGKVRIHPFAWRLSVRDVSVADTAGAPCLTWSNLLVDLQAASIWRRELALREVTLDSPRVRIRREPEGPWNLLALLEHVQSRTATDTNRAPSADTNLFPVTISHLALTNGIVEVADHGVATPFEARAGFRLVAIDLSTRAGARGTIDLAVHGDQAEEIAWGGSIVIQPLAIEGTLVAEGLRPSRAGAYMEGVSPYAITSGVVRLNLTAGFSPSSVSNHPPDVQVRKGLISVQDLAVVHAASRAPFLTAGTIDLENLEAALATQSIALQRLAIRSGAIDVLRSATPTNANAAANAPAAPDLAAGAAPAGILPDPQVLESTLRDLTTWNLALNELLIDDFSIRLLDETLAPPLALALGPAAVSIANLSNRTNGSPVHVEVRTRWPGSGALKALAAVTIAPVTATLRLDLDALDLQPFHPYVGDLIPLTLNRGFLSAGLDFRYGSAASGPLLTATGGMVVSDFTAMDDLNHVDFIEWEAIELRDIDVALQPNRLAVGEVVARRIGTTLLVNTNGQINLLAILQRASSPDPDDAANEQAPPPAEEEAGDAPSGTADASGAPAEWPVHIHAVRVEDLSLFAADRFYGEGFESTIESLQADIRDITLPADRPVRLDVRGRINALSELTLAGEVLPRPNAMDADLRLRTERADITQFTPYSIRFAGYPIAEGQLTADVHYQVTSNQLQAENKILIEKFTLGDKVESPDAIDLPLKLGVALLKDSSGRIQLDIPLSGDLNSPEFRIAPIIGQAVRNIIMKAVTAPFSALASIFGSKEELEFVEFEPGRADVPSSQTNRLATLATALIDRRQLNLEILPGFHPAEDRRGIARVRIESRLRDLRLEEYATQGTATTEVRLTPQDRARLIPRLFEKRFGTGSAAPAAGTLDPESMEQRLIEIERVQPEDLHALATRRAELVRDALARAGVDPSRITIAPEGSGHEGEGKPRVTFRLQ